MISKTLGKESNLNDLTPTDIMLHNYIVFLMDEGITYDDVKRIGIHGIKDKSTRSRKRKVIDRIYDNHIKGTDIDKDNAELTKFYEWLGYKQ